MNAKRCTLILEDGSAYHGFSFGSARPAAGEVVFTTGMAGYPQSLTDPSYAGQILVFTYPLIGNYGVNTRTKDAHGILSQLESGNIHVKGIIVSSHCEEHNHWNSDTSLDQWMRKMRIPGIFGVDTRGLTIKLREKGTLLGKIVMGDDISFHDPNKDNLVMQVSRKEPTIFGSGRYKVVAVDCGMKNSILRRLLERDVTIKVVPWDHDFIGEDFDGLFISNGPGDPTRCTATIANIRHAMAQKKPILGICLGHQILALAAGAKTYKLKFGHRGQNQPCSWRGKGVITSQNHGFAVDSGTLPEGWEETFTNVNDGTNEGIRHKALPFMSVQFHPEGNPGPTDSAYLFDDFLSLMKVRK